MVSKTTRADRGVVANLPPSLARTPSCRDPHDPSPEQIEQIIRDLPLKKEEEDNSAADARAIFECYEIASLARVWQRKRKSGAAGLKVVRDLKQIASRSSTLLERLKRADGTTFEAWAAVQYPEAGTLESGAGMAPTKEPARNYGAKSGPIGERRG